jgi:hypothetical protein
MKSEVGDEYEKSLFLIKTRDKVYGKTFRFRETCVTPNEA